MTTQDNEIKQKIDKLISKMTLEEKAGQLNQVPATIHNKEEVRELARKGLVGSRILASTAWAGNEEQQTADQEETNIIQKIAVEESRLGIPVINGRDIIHGHRTVFPINIGQAASWNPALVEQAAHVAAAEARAVGVHWTFAPMVDVARDPRWGRIVEGAGEDPFLNCVMAVAQVRGYQGDDPSNPDRMLACAKHFAGYGAAEGGRDYNTCEISDNTLRNVYLPAFKAAVDAGCATIMSGFHDLNGESVSGSHYLLTEILKDDWGFDGFVISDWGSVMHLEYHGQAGSPAEAARIGFNAGVDMDMATEYYLNNIRELVESGEVSMERLDDAVRRILRAKFRAGLFDQPYTDFTKAASVLFTQEHREKALELATQSLVLLKNENDILPLKTEGKKIVVAGPLADKRRELLGTWMLDGRNEDTQTVVEALKQSAPEGTIIDPVEKLSDALLHDAQRYDAMVLVVGESPRRAGEASNVATLDLPPGQEELIERIGQLGVPLVVVVCAPRPLSINAAARYADTIVYAWHPGTMGGQAIADVLLGKANPSGKLPVSLLRSVGQIPLHYQKKNTGHPRQNDYYTDESWYQDLKGSPLYPFGFGLSYTSFEYSDLEVDKEDIATDGSVRVSALLTNTGEEAGTEVAQCYIRDLVAETTRPVRELKGFERLTLQPGESRRIEFILGPDELGFYGRDGKKKVEPGEFHVWIGGDCLADLQGVFRVKR